MATYDSYIVFTHKPTHTNKFMHTQTHTHTHIYPNTHQSGRKSCRMVAPLRGSEVMMKAEMENEKKVKEERRER